MSVRHHTSEAVDASWLANKKSIIASAMRCKLVWLGGGCRRAGGQTGRAGGGG